MYIYEIDLLYIFPNDKQFATDGCDYMFVLYSLKISLTVSSSWYCIFIYSDCIALQNQIVDTYNKSVHILISKQYIIFKCFYYHFIQLLFRNEYEF